MATLYSDNYGHYIYEARIAKSWTQQQLADKLGVSRQTINSWENNNTAPSLEHAADLLDVLPIPVKVFFDLDRIKED